MTTIHFYWQVGSDDELDSADPRELNALEKKGKAKDLKFSLLCKRAFGAAYRKGAPVVGNFYHSLNVESSAVPTAKKAIKTLALRAGVGKIVFEDELNIPMPPIFGLGEPEPRLKEVKSTRKSRKSVRKKPQRIHTVLRVTFQLQRDEDPIDAGMAIARLFGRAEYDAYGAEAGKNKPFQMTTFFLVADGDEARSFAALLRRNLGRTIKGLKSVKMWLLTVEADEYGEWSLNSPRTKKKI